MRHHQLSMSDSNVADFFSKGSPASVRQGTLFEIKLNGADFFFFSKLISYPESPGNRLHPHYRLISLALTLYAIEAEVRGCSAEQRLAARKARAAPLMQSLYDWIQTQMKTLSRHSDTAKAFAYLLKQWEA